jgi:hypothetical protein
MKSREVSLLKAGASAATLDVEDFPLEPEALGGAFLCIWMLRRRECLKAMSRRSRMLASSFMIEALSLKECVSRMRF